MPLAGKFEAIKDAYALVLPTGENLAVHIGETLGCEISKSMMVRFFASYPDQLRDYPLEGHGLEKHRGKAAPREEEPAVVVVEFNDPDLRRRLLGLRFRDCRWIVEGSGEHAIFCCELTDIKQSYCAHHAQMNRGRGTDSERSAIKDLARSMR